MVLEMREADQALSALEGKGLMGKHKKGLGNVRVSLKLWAKLRSHGRSSIERKACMSAKLALLGCHWKE